MTLEAAKKAALDRLWQEIEAAPTDESKHTKFVRFAVDSELYVAAIERYKSIAAQHPELSARMQKAITGQAAAKVLARSPVVPQSNRSRGVKMVAAFLAAIFAIIAWAQCGDRAPKPVDVRQRHGQVYP